MPSLDLLVPALAGYLFLRLSNFTKFGLLRESGYHVVFRSVLMGLLLYMVGTVAAEQLPTPDGLERTLESAQTRLGISAAGGWSLLLGLIAPLLPNIVYRSHHGARRAADKKGDFVDLLVDEASRTRRTVEISLRGGKTYIGYVAESRIGKQGLDEGALVLVPLLSGYRSEPKHRLVLSTSYARLLIDEPRMWEDLKVAIPRADVRWARLFDPYLYSAPEGEALPEELGDHD